MDDFKFYTPIIVFGVIIFIIYLTLYNHKKLECEKSGGLFYSERTGKITYYRCYR